MSYPPRKSSVPSKWKIQFSLEVYQLDYQNEDNLTIALNHLSNFFKQFRPSHVELVSLLRKKHKFSLRPNGPNGEMKFTSKDSYARDSKIIQDDEPCFDLWKGTIELEESPINFFDLINLFSGPVGSLEPVDFFEDGYFRTNLFDKQIGFLWKFIEENDQRFEKYCDFSLESGFHSHRLPCNGFSFGNIVNGMRFIEQYNSRIDLSPATNKFQLKYFDFNLHHTSELMELNLLVYETDDYDMDQRYQLVFDYKSVKQVILSRSKFGLNIFFHLSHPPKISIATHDLNPDIVDMKKSKFYAFDYCRYRRDRFPRQRFSKESWTRWHDCQCISSTCIGKSSVFSLNLDPNQPITDIVRKFYVWRRYSNLDISFGFIEVLRGVESPFVLPSNLPFEVDYALECIQSVSFAFDDDLIVNKQYKDFINFIRDQVDSNNTDWLVTAMYKLCNDYLYGKVYHGLSRLKTIFKRIEKDWSSIDKIKSSSKFIKQLRRVILTPTRVLILPELAFQSSQFLEIAERDCVLRLNIRDEDMSNLGYAVARGEEDIIREEKRLTHRYPEAKYPSPEMYFLGKCVADRLLPSLDIARKSFRIYGASSSQLREHGMVLYAKDSKGRDSVSIRNEIGEIKSKGISKYISRVGLSLTQVLAFVDLPQDIEIRYTNDILDGQHPESFNPYNFTDGCGLMSIELAKYIWSDLKGQGAIKLDPEKTEKMATAYQIRFMGCKGMIVLDESLSGKVIVLRESMRKLDSVADRIGIVKISEPRRAYLNRPLVTILNQMGLSNDFFVDLLSDAIGDLVDSFHDNIKASNALKMFSYLKRFINHTKLAKLRYDLLGDPFFRSALDLVFHQGLDVIKQKARIPLDMNNARTLFGVADPTATYHLPYAVIPNNNDESQVIKIRNRTGDIIHSFPIGAKKSLFLDEKADKALKSASTRSLDSRKGRLKYGQVFVFPSDFERPYVGTVLVTKFPCMHPGDVQLLEAVDIPELHGIRDCVVFPVEGHRPHPNEMAGSDLDGDEYCVIWDPAFTQIRIEKPMDFPDSPSDSSESIENQQIVKFYMRFLRDSAVGRIASSHLVWADMLPRGIFSDLCLTLAEKYSYSLDFVKTGITALPNKDENYREAPDFTQNWSLKPSYHSSRALGSIYRTISMFELFLGEETTKLKIMEPTTDYRLTHPKWKRYELFANKQHEIYCSIVSYLLEIYEFADEVELFTQITEKSSLFGSNDNKVNRPSNYQDTMIYCVDYLLVKPMEENFYEEFNSPHWKNASKEELNEAYAAKASAYYKITMKKTRIYKKSFSGLPWIGRYSSHLFDLLENPRVSNKPDRLVARLNTPTVGAGFSGNLAERNKAADSCWGFLKNWLYDYLFSLQVDPSELDRMIFNMADLFRNIVQYYISGNRKKSSPGSVLRQIFSEIRLKRKSLDFARNLFDACNDPIGLMAVLILERKYYEGTVTSKLSDGTFNCWSNSTYRVLMGENTSNAEINEFVAILGKIAGCVSIVHTPAPARGESYKLSIFGSRASILICQAIIGLHNRLLSSYPHYQIGM